MFNVRPEFGFNVSPQTDIPGFRVGLPDEDLPGLRVGQDRSVRPNYAGTPALNYDPYGNALQPSELAALIGSNPFISQSAAIPGFRVGHLEDVPSLRIGPNILSGIAPNTANSSPSLVDLLAQGGGDIHPAASANDPQGLKMANDAAREAVLNTPELRQKFHREISGKGITSYQELLSIARQIKAGTY